MSDPAGRAREQRGQGGFTIVEVVIAIIVLTFGVLALAGTTALLVRQVTLGQLATERAVAFQSTVEYLRALDWNDVGDGSDTIGPYEVEWWIDEDGANSRVMKILTVGPGISTVTGVPSLRNDVHDTFTYRILNY